MGRPIHDDPMPPGLFCLVKSARCSHANSNQLGESPPVSSRVILRPTLLSAAYNTFHSDGQEH